jgi:cell shape-determining protein MreC
VLLENIRTFLRQNYVENFQLDDPLETLQLILDGINRQQVECESHKAENENLKK